MNIVTSFPPELSDFVQRAVATGRYGSEEELLVDAVRQLREKDAYIEAFRAQMRERIAQLDRGDAIVLEDDAALERWLMEIENEVFGEVTP